MPACLPRFLLSDMKYQTLINDLRSELVELAMNVETSSAMGLYDIHRLCENVVLGLFREIFNLPNLRNLNAADKKNYPAVDLADDSRRIAIQVTATPTLEKIRDTLSSFLRHGLDSKYDKLIIYVITRKQRSYSDASITSITADRIDFKPDRDVLDFTDLATRAVDLSPPKVQAILDLLRTYKRGAATGMSTADFDPLAIYENVTLNLIEIFFPPNLYIGDLLPDQISSEGRYRRGPDRAIIRDRLKNSGLWAPTDFTVNAGRIITFHALDCSDGPFSSIVDQGTVTPISPDEFSNIDGDHERILKSLLRHCLQVKLYRERVQWKHDDYLFIFLPRDDADLIREESWEGERQSSRRVFERKLSKNDKNKTFICKHFAFGVDFVRSDDKWFAAFTPDWFFSYGDDYRRSLYADQNLSWLKRRENNRAVANHFRFIAYWLQSLDVADLFSPTLRSPQLSFGSLVRLAQSPYLNDEEWLPTRDSSHGEGCLFDKDRIFDTL